MVLSVRVFRSIFTPHFFEHWEPKKKVLFSNCSHEVGSVQRSPFQCFYICVLCHTVKRKAHYELKCFTCRVYRSLHRGDVIAAVAARHRLLCGLHPGHEDQRRVRRVRQIAFGGRACQPQGMSRLKHNCSIKFFYFLFFGQNLGPPSKNDVQSVTKRTGNVFVSLCIYGEMCVYGCIYFKIMYSTNSSMHLLFILFYFCGRVVAEGRVCSVQCST